MKTEAATKSVIDSRAKEAKHQNMLDKHKMDKADAREQHAKRAYAKKYPPNSLL